MNPKEWIKSLQDFLNEAAKQLNVHRFKEYYLEVDFKLYEILIPIIDGEQTKIWLWPAGLISRRKYPLAVYLLSVAIYQTSNYSMREVAKLIRKEFGLERFSHSTISRARKSLLTLLTAFEEEFNQDNQDPGLVPKKKNPTPLHLRLCRMLKDVLQDPLHETEQLAFHFFKRYQRFLL